MAEGSRPGRRGPGARRFTGAVAAAVVALLGAAGGSAWAAGGDKGPSPPGIGAPAAILVDGRDGTVLYARAPRERRQIASTTKLMTALLARELLPLDREVTAGRYRAGPAESRINLRPGERMEVADLLRALLLESANDAAVTLARAAGGSVSGFVDLMNARARQLGLSDTHFTNPVGLDDPGNRSSARDLAHLARRALRDAFLAETVDMPRARLTTGARQRVVENRNALVRRFGWVDGVKTGHTTQAGYVLVGAADRKRVPLVSVVLGAASPAARDMDTVRLLNYGYSLYDRKRVLKAGRTVARARVAYHGDRTVALTPARDLALTVRRGQRIRRTVDAPAEVDGPLAAGSRVGWVTVRYRDRTARVPLITADAVPGAGPLRKLSNWLLRPVVLIPFAVVAVVALGRRRRRRAAAEAARRRRRRSAQLD